MFTLGNNILKLRKNIKLTQERLAKLLNVSRQAISRWEADITIPDTNKIILLADIFECSIDFLLCIDESKEIKELSNEVVPFNEKLISLRKDNHITQEQLADYLCVSRQSVYKWEFEGVLPEIEKIIEISKLFNVSIDYLLRNRKIKNEIENVDNSNTKIKKILFIEDKVNKILFVLTICFMLLSLTLFSIYRENVIKLFLFFSIFPSILTCISFVFMVVLSIIYREKKILFSSFFKYIMIIFLYIAYILTINYSNLFLFDFITFIGGLLIFISLVDVKKNGFTKFKLIILLGEVIILIMSILRMIYRENHLLKAIGYIPVICISLIGLLILYFTNIMNWKKKFLISVSTLISLILLQEVVPELISIIFKNISKKEYFYDNIYPILERFVWVELFLVLLVSLLYFNKNNKNNILVISTTYVIYYSINVVINMIKKWNLLETTAFNEPIFFHNIVLNFILLMIIYYGKEIENEKIKNFGT